MFTASIFEGFILIIGLDEPVTSERPICNGRNVTLLYTRLIVDGNVKNSGNKKNSRDVARIEFQDGVDISNVLISNSRIRQSRDMCRCAKVQYSKNPNRQLKFTRSWLRRSTVIL